MLPAPPAEEMSGRVNAIMDVVLDRVKHLTTQLHWRLNEGNGTAFYEIGVRDNGEAIGICKQSMIKSLQTLFGSVHFRKEEDRAYVGDDHFSSLQNVPSDAGRALDCAFPRRP